MKIKYIELINMEIDGVNTPAESRELKRYLASHPEAKQLFEELSGLDDLLRKAGKLELPDGLSSSIISSIESRKDTRIHKRNIFAPAAESLRRSFKPAYAYLFVAGIIAGFCLLTLLSRMAATGSSVDLEDLYGSIMQKGSGEQYVKVAPIGFETFSVSGSIRSRYFEQRILTEVELVSEEKIEVILEGTDDLLFEGFRILAGSAHVLQTDRSRIKLSNIGISEYVLFFKGKVEPESSISMKIFSNGTLLFEKTIFTGRI